MPKIETIKVSEAPPQLQKMTPSSQEIYAALQKLQKDEVLRVQPDPGKAMRGLKSAVSRLASRHRLKLVTWSDDNHEFLYVRHQ